VDWFVQLKRFLADEVVDLGISGDAVGPEDMRRIRIISITTIALCVVAGVPAVVQFIVLDMWNMTSAIVATMGAAVANLLLLRVRRRPRLSAHLGLAILGSLLVMSNVMSGGFYDPNFAWLYVLPLGAAALIDMRGAAIWTGLTLGLTMIFWLLPSFGFDLPNQIPEAMRESNALFNRVTAISAIGVIAASFVAGQRRNESQLAQTNNELLAETAYVHLLMHAAISSNEAQSFEDAMRDCMGRICDTMGWVAGHIYAASEDGSITTSGIVHIGDSHRDSLRDLAGSQRFQKGFAIVGRAAAEGTPQIVEVLPEGHGPNDPIAIAKRSGVRAAMAVPVFVNGDVSAVMLFAAGSKIENTERLREMFSLIGVQLGKVAERTTLQERLQQGQKMEAVGQLAAGVAHEINNPMSYVRTNLHTLREEWSELRDKLLPENAETSLAERFDDCQELIEESLEGVERTISIVRDVKEFSHNGVVDRTQWETLELGDLLDSALRVVAGQAPSQVQIDSVHEDAATCRCSPNQIRQVFVNLIVNSIQALGESGRIVLTTGKSDGCVFARVEDDGPGIEEATRERLFDPFFTTKAVGEGTGLGLSVSYEIVRNHDGEILVVSEPGQGACFEVRLPAART
jgi:signal transduction histidine kinase